MNDYKNDIDFVLKLDLPDIDSVRTLESAGEDPAVLLPSYGKAGQSVVIGSQIAEFASSVDPELRPHIANSFLIAQLAADKEIKKNNGDKAAWYTKYLEILGRVGWIIEAQATTERDVSGSALEVHKEIIPVILAALAPAAATAIVVMKVLDGLGNMSKDTPWITLFNRESQRAQANLFQIGYIDASDGSAPQMTLVCFDLTAAGSVTQVLFFKFSSAQARLSHFQADIALNEALFKAIMDAMQDRVADYVVDYVRRIDI